MVTKVPGKIIIYIWFSTSINSLDHFEKKKSIIHNFEK